MVGTNCSLQGYDLLKLYLVWWLIHILPTFSYISDITSSLNSVCLGGIQAAIMVVFRREQVRLRLSKLVLQSKTQRDSGGLRSFVQAA